MSSEESLWELIHTRVSATPDAMMMVDGDMRIVTFAEFWHEAELAAAGLLALGVEPGDVVTWQLPTSVESVVLIAALSRIGAVQCPLLPHASIDDAVSIMTAVGSTLLVLPTTRDGNDVAEAAARAATDNPGLRMLVLDGALPQGDVSSLPPLPDRWNSSNEEGLDGTVRRMQWIFDATGVGSTPGHVCHDDRSLSAAASGIVRRLGLIEHDRNAFVSPMTGITGILWLFASLESGCSNILLTDHDVADVIDVLSREGVTLVGVVSGFLEACIEEQKRSLHPLFPDLRAFIGSGEAARPELHQPVADLFGVPVLSYYGMLEAPVVAMADLSDPGHKITSTLGRVQHAMELRVTDDRGAVVDPGVEGELRVRGAQMMLGYHDHAADVDAFDEDGLFRTGDLGVIDEDGYVRVTGRVARVVVDDVADVDDVVIDVSDGATRSR